MDAIKKIIVFVILVAIASFGFISCSMKKIIIVLLIMLLGCNTIVYCKSTEQTKSKGKVETTVVVPGSEVKDTISAMEKAGWTYDGMHLNKDNAWKIGFIIYTKSERIKIKDKNIPDGTYHARSYNIREKKEVDHILIVKNNYIIKQFEDGKEIEVEASDIE